MIDWFVNIIKLSRELYEITSIDFLIKKVIDFEIKKC